MTRTLGENLEGLRAILNSMKSHREATHARANETSEAIECIERALTIMSDTTKLLVTTEIEKLQLKPGDAHIVKLGDRATGWMPGPEQEDHAKRLFSELIGAMKLDVPVLVYHYGVELETIQKDLTR